MSLDRLINKISLVNYNPTEEELFNIIPLAITIKRPDQCRWFPEDIALLLARIYGLQNERKHKFKELAEIYNLASLTLQNLERVSIQKIRRYLIKQNINYRYNFK